MTTPATAAFIADLFAPHPVEARSAPAAIEHVRTLFAGEAAHLEPMVGGRRAEYATGRACAHAALAALDASGATAIQRDERGAPIWPDGVTGSISHTEGFCAAVAAQTSPTLASIGLDIERIDRVGERVRRRILTASELAAVEAMPAAEAQRRTAMTFAAKEAFYKAQYQLTSTYLGFGAVEVRFDDDAVGFVSGHPVVSSFVGQVSGRLVEHEGRVIAAVFVAASS